MLIRLSTLERRRRRVPMSKEQPSSVYAVFSAVDLVRDSTTFNVGFHEITPSFYQPSEVVRFRWCREIPRLGIFTPSFPSPRVPFHTSKQRQWISFSSLLSAPFAKKRREGLQKKIEERDRRKRKSTMQLRDSRER